MRMNKHEFWTVILAFIIFYTNVCLSKTNQNNRLRGRRGSVLGQPIREPPCAVKNCTYSEGFYCGSNGRTYNDQCATKIALCADPSLTFTLGKCPESDMCIRQRAYAMDKIRNSSTGLMVVCNQDGSFAPLQCFMGRCWCSDRRQGKLLTDENSGGRIKRKLKIPKCGKRPKHTNRCKTDIEKFSFAYKVSSLIQMDFRLKSPKRANKNTRSVTSAVDAVRWKMASYTRDRIDNFMTYREFKSMFKPYRKGVSRKCTKIFPKYCDVDRDMKVTERELLVCMGVIRDAPTLPPSNSIESITNQRPEQDSNIVVNNFTTRKRPDTSRPVNNEPTPERPTCRGQQNGILKVLNRDVYIPKCEGPNGEFYQRVQCHEKTGYCFCVNRDDGKPVPNTSTSNGIPNCDVHTTSRPIPGCSQRLKDKFLKSVVDILVNKWSQLGRYEVRPEEGLDISDEERASRWYFDNNDADNDGVFNRSENKAFKKLLTNSNVKSRKCLKRFSQHCDANGDRKLTVAEFVSCLEVNIVKPSNRQKPSLIPAILIGQLKTTDDPESY